MAVRKSPPTLRRHKPSRQGVVTLEGRDHYLGLWRDARSSPPPEVQTAYDALIAEWLAHGRRGSSAAPLTISELLLRFWEQHVSVHYRHRDGTETSEIGNFKLSLRPLRALYGSLAVDDFTPLKLKAVRQSMIDSGLCRGVVNQRIGRIKRMFKWAVAEELVPESVCRALLTVDGLKAGRSNARETEPVKPVTDEDIAAVLPFLSRPLQGLVQVQRMTGMRPGEVMCMRGCELDTSGLVWFYRPVHHKTAWRQKTRAIPIGPRCQQILQSFLKPDPQAFLFSPRDGREEWFAAKRAARKSRVQPSQRCRRKPNPRRKPRESYSRHSYAAAIARACVKAGVPRWHPNRLRHSRATEIRRQFGLEAAQVLLGHARANITELYAQRDFELAERVAAEAG